MLTLLLLTMLVLAALTAASAHASHLLPATPKLDRLSHYRATLNTIRERKCLPRIVYRWRLYEVPPAMRSYVVLQTKTWIFDARDASSRCVPHRDLWECIHDGEGAWNDPNPPYFGGLQMGYWFMGEYGDAQTFGRPIYRQEGTADNWSSLEQMRVAAAAYREEGYSLAWLRGQWPRSHRPCVGGVL